MQMSETDFIGLWWLKGSSEYFSSERGESVESITPTPSRENEIPVDDRISTEEILNEDLMFDGPLGCGESIQ